MRRCQATAQLVIHLLVGPARLDRGEAQHLVDFQNAMHALADIDENLPGLNRAPEAISPVLACTEAVERGPVFVRNAHNRLYVCGRGRKHHAGRAAIPTRQEIAAIAHECVFGSIDGLTA
jgi:hypothetical protein